MPDVTPAPSAAAIDSAFSDTLLQTATTIAGPLASTLIGGLGGPFMDLLTQLFTGLVTSCLGSTPAPTPPAPGGDPATEAAPPVSQPMQVAQNMKNITGLQQAVLHTRARKLYVQNGMTRQHGNIAAQTLIQASAATPVEHLAIVVDHVNNTFPEVEMF